MVAQLVMMAQRLCVTVTAPTMAELRRRRDASADADLVELRLDSVRDPDVAGALADRRRPVIVTCRPTWEGGSFAGSEEERKRLLAEALTSGAEYVDLEASAGFDQLIASTGGRRIVLSAHDFDGVPPDLESRIRAMRSTGAEVVKFAVATTRLSDCVTLRDVASRVGERAGLVLIGMGDHGVITRVLPSRFRSMWTYAGRLGGVGQLTPDILLTEFRFRELGPSTAVYGVVGSPVSHSVSPAMHNAAFRAARVDAIYLPLPAADADDFVTFARAFGMSGASVTIPFKIALAGCVDETSDLAARIGAINTIRVDGGRWTGDNSDGQGFLDPIREQLPLTGLRASLLGAGGAARGVAIALASNGAAVTVHARNPARAADVAALVSGSVGAWPPEPGGWNVLVNCTPVGMYPYVDETPLAADRLAPGIVYDLVYNPPATRLLREAGAAGCRTIGGLEMLVGQARQQFEWWTGVRPSTSVMREAAARRLLDFTRDAMINRGSIAAARSAER
jgi:3-dehydroquinate dehydratase/shikimate dehydrogenase